jgi:hypothetical protein
MKHVTRLFSVLAVILLLATPLSALAQTSENPLCTGLSAEDCDFLTSAQGMIVQATSFAIPAMELSFNVNDGTSTTAFSMKASGEVMLPTSGQLLLHLVLTDITVEPADPTVPSALEVIVTDKMDFVKYNDEWYGEELSAQDQKDMQDAFGQVMGAVSMGGIGAVGIDLTGVVTTTRVDDVDMMGMTMADFKTSVDVGNLLVALLASPALGMVLGSSGADLGMGELTPQDMQMMGALFAPMLTGTTIDLEEWFGVEDMYLHKFVLDVKINVNLGMFGGDSSAPITGALYLSIELDQVNQTFEVTLPENYKSMNDLNLGAGGLDLGGLGLGM